MDMLVFVFTLQKQTEHEGLITSDPSPWSIPQHTVPCVMRDVRCTIWTEKVTQTIPQTTSRKLWIFEAAGDLVFPVCPKGYSFQNSGEYICVNTESDPACVLHTQLMKNKITKPVFRNK